MKVFRALMFLAMTSSPNAFAQAGVSDGEWTGKYTCGDILVYAPLAPPAFSVNVVMRVQNQTAILIRGDKTYTESLTGQVAADGRLRLAGPGSWTDGKRGPWRARFEGALTQRGFVATGAIESPDSNVKYRDCTLALTKVAPVVAVALPQSPPTAAVVPQTSTSADAPQAIPPSAQPSAAPSSNPSTSRQQEQPAATPVSKAAPVTPLQKAKEPPATSSAATTKSVTSPPPKVPGSSAPQVPAVSANKNVAPQGSDASPAEPSSQSRTAQSIEKPASPLNVGTPGETQQTRYGILSVSSDRVLLLDGKPIEPKVEGNSGLYFEKSLVVGDTDVVLVQDAGGTSCPAQYYLVGVAVTGARVSDKFGTCSDLATTSMDGTKLIVAMPGFAGPNESPVDREKAGQRKVVYVYENGTITKAEGQAPTPAAPVAAKPVGSDQAPNTQATKTGRTSIVLWFVFAIVLAFALVSSGLIWKRRSRTTTKNESGFPSKSLPSSFADTTPICASCGAAVVQSASFCSTCGNALGAKPASANQASAFPQTMGGVGDAPSVASRAQETQADTPGNERNSGSSENPAWYWGGVGLFSLLVISILISLALMVRDHSTSEPLVIANWLLQALASLWVVRDAIKTGITKTTAKQTGLITTNHTPGVWGAITLFLSVLAIPLYLIRRPRLINNSRAYPAKSKSAGYVFYGVALALYFTAFLFLVLRGSLPACDDAVTVKLANQVIQESALVKLLDVKVGSIEYPAQASYDGKTRTCRAVLLNPLGGQLPITYTVTWHDEVKRTIYVEVLDQ